MVSLNQARRVFFLILSWYLSSISLQLYNKWLFSKDYSDFRYPLFTTMIHMIIQTLLSILTVNYFMPTMKPKQSPNRRQYLLQIIPCGLATGLDIGLSNSSLKYITLSFYTMVKSAAPVFILFFAFVFGLEKPSWKLTSAVAVICIGVAVMVASETKFNPFGYFQIQLATIISGLRWALTQVLLKGSNSVVDNPLATTMFLSPVVAASLLVASLINEDWTELLSSPQFSTLASSTFLVLSIIGGGGIAFLMVNIEFALICTTSVMTLSVAGIFKEIVTISAAVTIFGDVLTFKILVGLIISLIGIAAYNYIRIYDVQTVEKEYAELGDDDFQFEMEDLQE